MTEEEAPWIRRAQEDDRRRQRIREAATAHARTLDAELAEWAEDFGEWCADRYGYDDSFDTRMPGFKRAWGAYWNEPVASLVEDHEPEEEPLG